MRQDQSLDSCIVSNLLLIIENPPYIVHAFITSSLLINCWLLKEKRFRMLGTIRENRFMKCPMAPSKAVQKKKTGFL